MAHLFNDNKGKGLIKTVYKYKNSVEARTEENFNFTLSELGVNSLKDITILEVRQAYGDGLLIWEIGSQSINSSNNTVYPKCILNLATNRLIASGFNSASFARKLAIEVTYLVADVEHN